MLKPIIKWSGGKSDEIKKFEKYIPKDMNLYLEPFVGGGAVFFYINPTKAVISDVHPELIDFYQSIKDGYRNDIKAFMMEHPNDKETYYQIRDEMIIHNSLDGAKRFYYQRKTCYRGMLRYNKSGKFNIPFGNYKSINFNDLDDTRYEDILKKTTIYNKDFEFVFNNYNDACNFMFLDPPYDSQFTDYGYCEFGQENHKKLARLFKETKIRCLMVIGETDYIKELYKDYIVDHYEKKYRFKICQNRVGDEINNRHLIIKNF